MELNTILNYVAILVITIGISLLFYHIGYTKGYIDGKIDVMFGTDDNK